MFLAVSVLFAMELTTAHLSAISAFKDAQPVAGDSHASLWKLTESLDAIVTNNTSGLILKVVMKNDSKQMLSYISHMGTTIYPFRIEIRKHSGPLLPMMAIGKASLKPEKVIYGSEVFLKPGESSTFLVPIKNFYDLSALGSYYVTVYKPGDNFTYSESHRGSSGQVNSANTVSTERMVSAKTKSNTVEVRKTEKGFSSVTSTNQK